MNDGGNDKSKNNSVEESQRRKAASVKVCEDGRGDDEGVTPGTSGRSRIRN